MKKVKSIFALFVLFLMFSASNNRFPKTGLFVGEKAPNFQMTDSTAGTFDLRDLKGKYVVLNFWASYDASSRISNIRMRQEIEKLNHQNLSFVSVSYDPSRVIFEETVKLDELDRNTQLMPDYHLLIYHLYSKKRPDIRHFDISHIYVFKKHVTISTSQI